MTWVGWLQQLHQQKQDWRASHAARRNPDLLDVAAAWPRVCPTFNPPADPPGWDAAWGAVETWHWVVERLAGALGWDWRRTVNAWTSARELRLIYPDGTTSDQLNTLAELQGAIELRALEKKAALPRSPK